MVEDEASVFLVGILVFIVMQVTNLRYPKPTKKAVLFVPCVVLVVLLVYWGQTFPALAVRVAVVIIGLGFGYVLIGPLFVKGIAARKARKEAARNGE